jgi:hypothetical protein
MTHPHRWLGSPAEDGYALRPAGVKLWDLKNALDAAPGSAAAYMSLTAFSTGAGGAARSGSIGWFMSLSFWMLGKSHPLSATGAR